MQSLESVPTWFSDTLDISLEAAQIILSLIVILAVLLPILILTKGKGVLLPLISFFLTEALLVGIGWLSAWVMIATLCVCALAIAMIGTKVVTGGS